MHLFLSQQVSFHSLFSISNDFDFCFIGDIDSLNANKAITQNVEIIDYFKKEERLLEIINEHKSAETGKIAKMIIFMSRKADCDNLADKLYQEGIATESIHGDLSQQARTRTLDKFRKGSVRVLVATDVAARGLDIKVSWKLM